MAVSSAVAFADAIIADKTVQTMTGMNAKNVHAVAMKEKMNALEEIVNAIKEKIATVKIAHFITNTKTSVGTITMKKNATAIKTTTGTIVAIETTLGITI